MTLKTIAISSLGKTWVMWRAEENEMASLVPLVSCRSRTLWLDILYMRQCWGSREVKVKEF
jgi:hypothetical protein